MKREAVSHTKMKRLCRALDVPLYQAVGMLELLWHTTSRQAPRGDIGRLTDDDIALSMDYRQDSSHMVSAICAAGWMDDNAEHRLIVHDWPDHAEDGVHMKLARAKQFFVCSDPKDRSRTLLLAPRLYKLPSKDHAIAQEFYSAHGMPTADGRRAHALRTDDLFVRTDDLFVRTEADGVRTACSPPRLDPALTPPLKQEESTNFKESATAQHHHPNGDDDVVLEFAQAAADLAGLARLSKADLGYCRELHASGMNVDEVRAGIIIGKARRLIHESKTGAHSPIQSLRYFSGPFDEARQGLFEPGYVSHTESWIQRKEKQNGNG